MDLDKLKPIIKHRSDKKCETKNGYAVDVYNAILQTAEEAAQVEVDPMHQFQAHCAGQTKKDGHPCSCRNSGAKRGEHDPVNHPNHYCQGGIECIDAIEAAVTGLSGMEAVCAGNAIKYIWRFHNKNGVEDLKKARFYLNKLILLVDKKGNND